MKTLKQIADELCLDKQKVYRFVKKNHINEAHQKGGVMYYDDAAEAIIASHFLDENTSSEGHQTTSKSTSNDAVDAVTTTLIEMLQRELAEKNRQIDELTRIIREQAESINADRKNELAGTLLDGSQKILPADSSVDQPTPAEENPRGIFAWLARKMQNV